MDLLNTKRITRKRIPLPTIYLQAKYQNNHLKYYRNKHIINISFHKAVIGNKSCQQHLIFQHPNLKTDHLEQRIK